MEDQDKSNDLLKKDVESALRIVITIVVVSLTRTFLSESLAVELAINLSTIAAVFAWSYISRRLEKQKEQKRLELEKTKTQVALAMPANSTPKELDKEFQKQVELVEVTDKK